MALSNFFAASKSAAFFLSLARSAIGVGAQFQARFTTLDGGIVRLERYAADGEYDNGVGALGQGRIQGVRWRMAEGGWRRADRP
jgi:hypothetical protein